MIIKCEFCKGEDIFETDNPYLFIEHLEGHIAHLQFYLAEQKRLAEEQFVRDVKEEVIEKEKPKPNTEKRKYTKRRTYMKGKRLNEDVAKIITDNVKMSPQETQKLILDELNMEVPIQTIYNWKHNHLKGRVKSVKTEEKVEEEVAEKQVEEIGENEVFSQSVLNILEVYEDDSPVELSERIKSSLGVEITPKQILDWRYNRKKK